jgi:hypothetical protein
MGPGLYDHVHASYTLYAPCAFVLLLWEEMEN